MASTEKVRTTAIALFPEAMSQDDAREVVSRLAAERELTDFRTVLRKAVLSDGAERTYIKFSKVVVRDEFGIGWVVKITGKLFDAGYEDVAWRLTRIDPDTADGESTTESFPVELFQAALAEDGDDLL